MSNFLSAFVKAELIKDNDRYTVDNFPIFFNSISSVTAEVSQGGIANVTIELTPTFKDGITILKSGVLGFGASKSTPEVDQVSRTPSNIDGAASSGSFSASEKAQDQLLENVTQLKVKFVRPLDQVNSQTNVSTETSWYTVSITQPSFNVSNSELTITLNGFAIAGSLGGHVVQFNIKEGDTALDLLRTSAKRSNLKLVFLDPTIERVLQAKILEPRTKKESALDTIKWLLGLCQLQFIVSANINAEGDSSGDKIVIGNKKDLANQTPKYKFVQWRQARVDAAIPEIPCHNFSVGSNQGLFLNDMAFGVYRLGTDAFKKEALGIEVIESVKQKETTTTGAKQIEARKDDPDRTGFAISVNSETDDVQDTAKDQYMDVKQAYQEITIESVGVPNILPLEVVEFALADIAELSGRMTVMKVVQTWNSSGWNTTITGNLTGGLGG